MTLTVRSRIFLTFPHLSTGTRQTARRGPNGIESPGQLVDAVADPQDSVSRCPIWLIGLLPKEGYAAFAFARQLHHDYFML